jgi:hypothetical protein
MSRSFSSFREFYPYYLSEHSDVNCRRLHVLGSALVLLVLAGVIARVLSPWWLLSLPFLGYGFAWIGHFAFEKNKPATFRYPLWSFIGDWVMFKDVLIGRVSIRR